MLLRHERVGGNLYLTPHYKGRWQFCHGGCYLERLLSHASPLQLSRMGGRRAVEHRVLLLARGGVGPQTQPRGGGDAHTARLPPKIGRGSERGREHAVARGERDVLLHLVPQRVERRREDACIGSKEETRWMKREGVRGQGTQRVRGWRRRADCKR